MKALKIKILLATNFCLAVTSVFSQTTTIVDQIVLSGTPTSSYLYNNNVRLTPGFNFKATGTATFSIRSARTSVFLSNDRNFVRVETMFDKAGSDFEVSNLPIEKKSTVYQYSDGLGRAQQTVNVMGSPSKNDVISYSVYDNFGRQPKEYLSYTTPSKSGAFISTALDDQKSFYQNPPAWRQVETEPYSVNNFDDSPQNRVTQTYGAGASWHKGASDKFVESLVCTNTAIELIKFTFATGGPTTTGSYIAGALTVSQSKDEQGLITRTYKNYQGQLLLQRTGNGTVWHDTYYVYDTYNNLSFVFSPEASSRLAEYAAATGVAKTDFLDRWVFQYQYDDYNRPVAKKLPGSGWVYTLYDKWDRPVLIQDGNLAAANKWIFTKFDAFNNEIITGIVTGLKADLQQSLASSVQRYESRSNNAVGYTNNAFPTNYNDADLLKITYYDDYAFKTYTGWDAEGVAVDYDFLVVTGYPTTADLLSTATVKGQVTGSKVRVGSTNTWLNAVTYYDKKYRPLQVISENNLKGVDRQTFLYDFTGRVIKSFSKHKSQNVASLTVEKEYTYDHAGRQLKTYHTINGGSKVLLTSNTYNELGQILEKNFHSTNDGTTFLQSVDYRYNIRGWTTQINNSNLADDSGITNNDANDLFGMDVVYNQEQVAVNTANSKPLYNGNISAIRWSKNNLKDTPVPNIYSYDYDVWSRLLTSNYASKNGATWSGNSHGFDENLTYDNNGNILTLKRNGVMGGVVVPIDDLSYKYELKTSANDATNTPYSNRLLNVTDNSPRYGTDNPDNGFAEAGRSTAITEYTYDNNGNVTFDANKNITQILYNHLNLPYYIEFYSSGASNRPTIEYTYDASGAKLKKVTKVGGNAVSTTDYIGGTQYDNGQLSFIQTDEGRAISNGGVFNYEYVLKDHQGNVRVVYGYQKEVDEYLVTMENERNTIETQDAKYKFNNVTSTRNSAYNHTSKNSEILSPVYGSMLTGTVGPAKILAVSQGDKLTLDAFARYTGTVNNSKLTATALATAVTSAFNLLPTGETAGAYNAISSAVVGNPVTGNTDTPSAYLVYILLSQDYTFNQFGAFAINKTEASVGFQALHLDVPVNFPGGIQTGSAYVYVVNENTVTPVYFDDISIIHEKANLALQVTQTSDYYPFGLANSTLSYQKRSSLNKNKYLFQGQEFQNDFGLNWYQYKYRMHDPAIGRFGGVDPLAEKYSYNSTYAFSENRVVDGVELEGAEVQLPSINTTMYGMYVQKNSENWDSGYLTGLFDWAGDALYNKYVTPITTFSDGMQEKGQNDNDYKKSIGMYSKQGSNGDMDMAYSYKNLSANSKILDGGIKTAGNIIEAQEFLLGGVVGEAQSTMFNLARPSFNAGEYYLQKRGFAAFMEAGEIQRYNAQWGRYAPKLSPGNSRMDWTLLSNRTGRFENSRVTFDGFGRQNFRVDFTDHMMPSDHSAIHLHSYEFGPSYSIKGKETLTNFWNGY